MVSFFIGKKERVRLMKISYIGTKSYIGKKSNQVFESEFLTRKP